MAADRSHRVVVATKNPGKVEEMRSAIAIPGWRFVLASDVGITAPDVVEDGGTFVDNALLKAAAYHQAFGMPSLADDSGLVVDALGGAPGVHSSRYAGEDASDAENNAKLLVALEGVPESGRTARFVCAVVYADSRGMPALAMGVCEGRIASAPRGRGGFGYDPLFLPADTPGRTMAELGPEEKNRISHRGRALRTLKALIGGPEAG
jgi:XTP/dITP diphosphohydrolase